MLYAVCYEFTTGSRQAAKGSRICEMSLSGWYGRF